MKYMLMIYHDEQVSSDSEREACYAESTRLINEIESNGQYLHSNPLHPTEMAASVRVREDKRFVTDGPFAETREQLRGYYLVDIKDVDEAIGKQRKTRNEGAEKIERTMAGVCTLFRAPPPW